MGNLMVLEFLFIHLEESMKGIGDGLRFRMMEENILVNIKVEKGMVKEHILSLKAGGGMKENTRKG
jgi:hypothetical protein